jgi:hypothetical protein
MWSNATTTFESPAEVTVLDGSPPGSGSLDPPVLQPMVGVIEWQASNTSVDSIIQSTGLSNGYRDAFQPSTPARLLIAIVAMAIIVVALLAWAIWKGRRTRGLWGPAPSALAAYGGMETVPLLPQGRRRP